MSFQDPATHARARQQAGFRYEAARRQLARPPERWREVFLLSAADGWTEAEIARVEGLPTCDVRPIVDASRAFLRKWLRSAAEVGAI